MDLGRSIDYLETRPDIDFRKLGFYGLSFGCLPRCSTDCRRRKIQGRGVVVRWAATQDQPPEVDSWNFAPRVHVPVLMVNGRDDFAFPVDTNQKLLFRLSEQRNRTRSTSSTMGATAIW
jgi:Dienelactone hydrolase and related enzymes